jgi:hypothetical protein
MLYRFLYLPFSPVVFLGALLFLWDCIIAIRKKGLREGTNFLWNAEHWVGISQKAGQRDKAARLCFTAATVCYLAWNLMSNSGVLAFAAASDTVYNLFLLLCLIKIFLLSQYSYRRLAFVAVCTFPLLCAAALAQNMVFLAVYLWLLAAKDVSLRPALWAGLAVTAAGMAVVFTEALAGIIPMDGLGDGNYLRGVQRKFALGFLHPNTTGYLLAFLVIGWYLLRRSHLKWFDWGLMAAGLAVITFVAKSRASMLVVLATLILGTLFSYLPRLGEHKAVQILAAALPAAMAAFSFLAAILYHAGQPLWDKLNGFTSGRLYLFQCAWASFRPTLFGQEIRTETVFTLDNSYLYIFYRMGVLCFVLFLLAMAVLIVRLLKEKLYGEAAVGLAMICYGFLECVVFWPAVNPAMWLLPAVLWGKKQLCFAGKEKFTLEQQDENSKTKH